METHLQGASRCYPGPVRLGWRPRATPVPSLPGRRERCGVNGGLMKTEDSFSPPGDQPDLNKSRSTKRPFLSAAWACCVCSRPAGPEGRRTKTRAGGPSPRRHLGPPSLHFTAFLGAAGWTSEGWSRGWRAGSCRPGPAGRGARAADPPGWGPPSPTPRCCPPSGHSAPDTRSGRSGTPHLRCCVFQRFG